MSDLIERLRLLDKGSMSTFGEAADALEAKDREKETLETNYETALANWNLMLDQNESLRARVSTIAETVREECAKWHDAQAASHDTRADQQNDTGEFEYADENNAAAVAHRTSAEHFRSLDLNELMGSEGQQPLCKCYSKSGKRVIINNRECCADCHMPVRPDMTDAVPCATDAVPEEKPIAFERAAEIVAKRLASFRLGLDADDPYAYTENEKLMAGHIVGSLWGQNLLNTKGENWRSVEPMPLPKPPED